MDQQILDNNNKLIAEFDGIKIPKQTHNELNWIIYDGVFQPMQYDYSWNWLMPVVEKIEALGYTVNIFSNMVHIYSDKHQIPLSIDTTFNKLRATYQAVVEFINWYNKQRK